MKVVINRCYGGFDLSNYALKRYAELNGTTPYFYREDLVNNRYIKTDENDRSSFVYCILQELENDKLCSYEFFWDLVRNNKIKILNSGDFDRTDSILIQVIEELGELANGRCAELRIVEIPDDVEWEINEYDGMETVDECHRKWY